MAKFCYSVNEEEYFGECDSRAECIQEAQDILSEEYEVGTNANLWTAEIVPPTNIMEKIMPRLVNNFIEQLDEALGEEIASDDWIVDISKDNEERLVDILFRFIKNNAKFRSYTVDNIEKHVITVEE